MTNKQAFELITFLAELSIASDTLLEHAKQRTLKNAKDFVEAYNEKIEDIRLDNCSTNEKGHILRDGNDNLIFTKEATKKMMREIRDFWNLPCIKHFSIHTSEDCNGLSAAQLDFLRERGFIVQKTGA